MRNALLDQILDQVSAIFFNELLIFVPITFVVFKNYIQYDTEVACFIPPVKNIGFIGLMTVDELDENVKYIIRGDFKHTVSYFKMSASFISI